MLSHAGQGLVQGFGNSSPDVLLSLFSLQAGHHRIWFVGLLVLFVCLFVLFVCLFCLFCFVFVFVCFVCLFVCLVGCLFDLFVCLFIGWLVGCLDLFGVFICL